jgi:hypothetical protein
MPEITGKSSTANLQEALDNALKQVRPPGDVSVSYTVTKISGSKGGLTGLSQLSVVIDTETN